MDKWLETRQFPTSLVSASGFVFKEDKVLMIKHKKEVGLFLVEYLMKVSLF